MNSKTILAGVLTALVMPSYMLAQASNGFNFDVLRAAHSADSLRIVSVRLQSELSKLTKANAARSDSIRQQRREIDALRPTQVAMITPTATKPKGPYLPSIEIDAEPQFPQPKKLALVTSVPVATVPFAVAPAAASAPAKAAPAPAPIPLPSAVNINGMFQFWMTAGSAGYRNSYRLRRAEIKASGVVAPKVSWVLMIDFGKTLSASSVALANGAVQTTVAQSSRALQDATILFQATPDIRIDAGQQKVPFGLEGSQSSGTLELVERALFMSDKARGGSFGDVRDAGIAVRGKWKKSLDYQVGVFNGSGESQNDVDANLAKALIGRIAFRPWTALQIGASGTYAGSTAGDAPRRDRDAVEVRVKTNRVLLQAEAASGHDAAIGRHGAYVHAGFKARPTLDLHARFDAWDPDVAREADAASATERAYLGGTTWTLAPAGLKLQADVVHRTYSAALAPSRWQLLLNIQTAW